MNHHHEETINVQILFLARFIVLDIVPQLNVGSPGVPRFVHPLSNHIGATRIQNTQ